MAGRIQYKILKNMPFYNAYSQYYYNEDDNLDFLDGSGINTTFKSDDLYTRITDEGYVNASDSDSMPDWRPITEVFIGNPTDINNSANIFLSQYVYILFYYLFLWHKQLPLLFLTLVNHIDALRKVLHQIN